MRLIFILLLPLLLAACSTPSKEDDPYADWTAKDFYSKAKYALLSAEFQTAIENLESLEARFPFSSYARQAQLDVAYAYYKFDEPDSAIAAADRFIRLNPRDPNVDYAWYLKGLSNFNRGTGFMDSWFPRDIAQHDSKTMQDAMQNFTTLVSKFPDSRYAGDAYQRLVYLRNKLAEQEILVAEYYIKREAWLAAAKRAQYTVEHYPKTPASRRALEIMLQAYEALNLPTLVADTRELLNTNKPQQVQTAEIQPQELPAPVIN
jgi:outer membrane protein assembly factor BamD